MLHMLMHGSSEVQVVDSVCSRFLEVIPYDGVDNALFSLPRVNVFTRELLDHSLHEVCVVGLPFRDAYSSWTCSLT